MNDDLVQRNIWFSRKSSERNDLSLDGSTAVWDLNSDQKSNSLAVCTVMMDQQKNKKTIPPPCVAIGLISCFCWSFGSFLCLPIIRLVKQLHVSLIWKDTRLHPAFILPSWVIAAVSKTWHILSCMKQRKSICDKHNIDIQLPLLCWPKPGILLFFKQPICNNCP